MLGQNGNVFNFAVWNNNQLIGTVEANKDYQAIEGLEDGDVNISYALYPEARGRGYITRAVNLLLEFLLRKGLKRAVIRVSPDNKTSLGIPRRCGFKQIKTIDSKDGAQLLVFVKELGGSTYNPEKK
ncbi:MAG: GNAT family N-acetyltransferase [Candidatus Sungbacteria bacterium]|nr:GNAT family N-acetyltransferase [Candidatus Sungbacteria bacterium]